MNGLTVAQLITLLQKLPQDILVTYPQHSESCLLEESDLFIDQLCEPRSDGWVANYRPDKVTVEYLVLHR